MTGILGRRRAGKDVMAAWLAAERRKKEGIQVLHNGGLTFGEYFDPLEMSISPQEVAEKLRNSVYVITEAHNFFNPARQMSTVQIQIANVIMQMGKFGSSLIWTTQYQERVSGQLKEQTDWAIRVRSSRRPWATARSVAAGAKDNRCAGFFPGQIFHKEHLPCLKKETYGGKQPHRFDIVAQWTMQKNHPDYRARRAPFQRKQLVFCAHRYYPLNRTGVLIDHTAILAYNSDTLRKRQEAEDLMRLNSVLVMMEEGRFRDEAGSPLKLQIVTEAQIMSAFNAMYPDRLLDDKTVRRFLRAMDVRPKGSTSGGRRYDLTRWKEEHASA